MKNAKMSNVTFWMIFNHCVAPRIIKRDQIIHTASILFYSMKRYYFLHLEKISSFFFNLIFLKYVVVLVLLSYPNCTLHTSTQRRKKGRKNKKKYLTMICKGVFFYEVLYPFLEAEKHDNLYQRRV